MSPHHIVQAPSILSLSYKKSEVRTAPKEYITNLYDGYADRFDKHLKALEYRTPALLFELVEKFCKVSWNNAVDLGCGTGGWNMHF